MNFGGEKKNGEECDSKNTLTDSANARIKIIDYIENKSEEEDHLVYSFKKCEELKKDSLKENVLASVDGSCSKKDEDRLLVELEK